MNVSNGTSTSDGKQMCQIVLKSIQNYRSYCPDKIKRTDGRTHARTNAHTHAHTPNCDCDNYVSLTASWLDKNEDACSLQGL